MKTSIINIISSEKLQALLDKATSYVEVLKLLGLKAYTGNHRTLKARIKKDNLSLNLIDENRKSFFKQHMSKLSEKIRLSEKDIFVENSELYPSSVRRFLLKHNLIDYKCGECSIVDIYNNRPIKLQLDHINGINSDNRLQNLRWLCPNCHSQTETFSGKNVKHIKNQNKQGEPPNMRRFLVVVVIL